MNPSLSTCSNSERWHYVHLHICTGALLILEQYIEIMMRLSNHNSSALTQTIVGLSQMERTKMLLYHKILFYTADSDLLDKRCSQKRYYTIIYNYRNCFVTQKEILDGLRQNRQQWDAYTISSCNISFIILREQNNNIIELKSIMHIK